ncbi:ABC transporter ATP-binding protein [Isoptericola sp. b441]|uniref:ABC transporter ATP-binding protein n=1 Tax=Actinotalea lenta TaxID=3064654 RepID=A0ABT9D9S8_9CELL|nr:MULTISPECIES: ABC transporter ATP-binding protein [unclassified Isoptericola]MDO8106061.1 ABC transporter ATP-binding protein [Isoptericola sp. b441]MDO8122220.1 ABC transporter ATP-binding protein [Isoptericola sp. b490]
MSAIRTSGLVKDYGSVHALRGLDLDVASGEVLGFLGPNGAGKTTTIRILLDLIRRTAGTVEVLGQDPRTAGPQLRSRIGYLPGEPALPPTLTGAEYLGYLASLRGGAPRLDDLVRRFGVELRRPIRTLSRGNKQKIALVQAFMHAPELYVLDEPTSGLDPLLQQEFRTLVAEVAGDGATVFLSSHVLAEVEQLTRRVAIVRSGRVVDVDDIAGLRARAGQEVELTFAAPVDAALVDLPGVSDVHVDGATVRLLLHGEPDALLRAVAPRHVTRIRAEDRELEDIFLDLYREGAA